MKVGDKVWVLREVLEIYGNSAKVTGAGGGKIWVYASDCRPVEPSTKQPTRGQKLAERTMKAIWAANDAVNETPVIEACAKTANDQLLQSLKDYPFGEPPVIKDCLATESSPPKILDSSSEPMREAFEGWIAPNYDWDQSYLGRNENRYFDSSVEMAWQAFQAGAEYQSSPLTPSPCMDGVDVDQFVDGIMEARGRTSDPLQVGDAVRFVSPGHKRHGTEGILKSIHHGSKNAYLFVSDCGQFHRYCTIAELEHYGKAETVDIKGSMQSLDGADTIQEGDLQWTDRDGKHRLCNFTIGMRVHEAIQRGKSHGEKWVFYRKFKEVGE